MRVRWLALLGLLLVVFAASPSSAHQVGLSRGEYTVSENTVQAVLTLARGEVASLATSIDSDHDGHLTPLELTSSRAAIERSFVGKVSVFSDDEPCSGTLTNALLTEEDGLEIRASYRCPSPPERAVRIDLLVLDELAVGHRHIAHA